MTNTALRTAAARALGIGIPAIGAGLLIWDLYDRIRVRPDGSGGLEHDPGEEPLSGFGTVWCWGQACSSSKQIAGETAGAAVAAQLNAELDSVYAPSGTNPQITIYLKVHCAGHPSTGPRLCTSTQWRNLTTKQQAYETCPDPSETPGLDGKCATKVWAPITPEVAATKAPDLAPAEAVEVAQKLGEDGYALTPYGPIEIDGPASQVGAPTTTTTTNPDGSIKTETKTPTYHYTYEGDTVTVTTTNTTVINNAGDVTTIEEEVPDEKDSCDVNPERVGCKLLGDPVDEPALERSDIPLVPQSVPFASSAGCPEPVGFTVYGKAYSIAFSPLCDVASWLRPIFLALGAAAAAFIFMQGFRT